MTEDATATSTSACAPMEVAPELYTDPSPTDRERKTAGGATTSTSRE